jgi:hypothetical protein
MLRKHNKSDTEQLKKNVVVHNCILQEGVGEGGGGTRIKEATKNI